VTFVADASSCHEILTIPREELCAPTPNPIAPIVGPESVILSSGEQHRRQRALLSPPFHGAKMHAQADAMARAVREQTAGWRTGDVIPLHATAQAITLRIIIQMVLGVGDGPLCETLARNVTAMMNANTAPLMLLSSQRRDLAGHGPWARLQRLTTEFDAMLADQIQLGRRCPVTGRGAILAQLLDEHDDHRALDDAELLQQLRTLVVAGHDTTASALAWTMYHIHHEPGVRDRLLAELAGAPPPEQLAELPYLSGVIAETLRMHPTVPIVLRKLSAPRCVAGSSRAAGDIVGIAVPALHFNPTSWPEPYRFEPERFTGHSPSPFEYLPFGGGYRRCLGAAFASYELAVSVGTLLRHYEFRVPDGCTPKPLAAVARGIATVPRREIELVVADCRP
jgi:cytochrome P450